MLDASACRVVIVVREQRVLCVCLCVHVAFCGSSARLRVSTPSLWPSSRECRRLAALHRVALHCIASITAGCSFVALCFDCPSNTHTHTRNGADDGAAADDRYPQHIQPSDQTTAIKVVQHTLFRLRRWFLCLLVCV